MNTSTMIPNRPATTGESAVAGLHASSPEPLPFAKHLLIRAFLLEREQGNVLIYSNGALDADAERWHELGGVSRQYLAHWHEAIFGDERTVEAVAAPLFVHAADAAKVRARRPVRATFARRHRFGDDLEVIPIPGHTPGSTAYLWDNGERRLLFTGDSVYLDQGEWVGAMLDSSDRESYVAGLERLAELDFDLLVPWAAPADGPFVAEAGGGEGSARLAEIADRLRRGADR